MVANSEGEKKCDDRNEKKTHSKTAIQCLRATSSNTNNNNVSTCAFFPLSPNATLVPVVPFLFHQRDSYTIFY